MCRIREAVHPYIMDLPQTQNTAEIVDRTAADYRDRYPPPQPFHGSLHPLTHPGMLRLWGDRNHRPIEIEKKHQAGQPDRFKPRTQG